MAETCDLHFTNSRFEPIARILDAETDYVSAGWEEFWEIGDRVYGIQFQTYRRSGKDGVTQFLVTGWDINTGSPDILVDHFGDLMDLLARWAPAIQAAVTSG